MLHKVILTAAWRALLWFSTLVSYWWRRKGSFWKRDYGHAYFILDTSAYVMLQIQTVDLMESVCFQESHCFWTVFVEFLLLLHAIKAYRIVKTILMISSPVHTTRGSLTIIWKNNTLSIYRIIFVVLQRCCFFEVILKQILQNTVLGLNPHNWGLNQRKSVVCGVSKQISLHYFLRTSTYCWRRHLHRL